ncbi:MAG: type IV toxin-antitoxin system AbiEi family antitoxin domain-containing protein [Pseudomonadota bacterium]
MRELPLNSPDGGQLFEIVAAQDGLFTTQQASQAGYSPQLLAHRLDAGRIIRVRRGVYRLVHFAKGVARAGGGRRGRHARLRFARWWNKWVRSLERPSGVCRAIARSWRRPRLDRVGARRGDPQRTSDSTFRQTGTHRYLAPGVGTSATCAHAPCRVVTFEPGVRTTCWHV